MLLMYDFVLLKMSTWYSKRVEESNNIWRINNFQCITLVVLYGQFMMHGQRNIKFMFVVRYFMYFLLYSYAVNVIGLLAIASENQTCCWCYIIIIPSHVVIISIIGHCYVALLNTTSWQGFVAARTVSLLVLGYLVVILPYRNSEASNIICMDAVLFYTCDTNILKENSYP